MTTIIKPLKCIINESHKYTEGIEKEKKWTNEGGVNGRAGKQKYSPYSTNMLYNVQKLIQKGS